MAEMFQMPAAQYRAQARSAAEQEVAYFAKLREAGWVYSTETGVWTHPGQRGTSISR